MKRLAENLPFPASQLPEYILKSESGIAPCLAAKSGKDSKEILVLFLRKCISFDTLVFSYFIIDY